MFEDRLHQDVSRSNFLRVIPHTFYQDRTGGPLDSALQARCGEVYDGGPGTGSRAAARPNPTIVGTDSMAGAAMERTCVWRKDTSQFSQCQLQGPSGCCRRVDC